MLLPQITPNGAFSPLWVVGYAAFLVEQHCRTLVCIVCGSGWQVGRIGVAGMGEGDPGRVHASGQLLWGIRPGKRAKNGRFQVVPDKGHFERMARAKLLIGNYQRCPNVYQDRQRMNTFCLERGLRMSRFSLAACWQYMLLLGLTVGSLPLLTGCGFASATPAGGVSIQVPKCAIEVSWARGYNSLQGLKQSNELDLAVQGKMTAISATSTQEPNISTDFTFTISKVLLDPHQLHQGANSKITIHQTGGWKDGALCQVSDDPLFHIGNEAILFLRQYSPGHYLVIGGPSGRFAVRSGLVQPINDEGVQLPPATTEEQFYRMLQTA